MKRSCFVGLFFLSGLILFAQNTKKQDPDKSDLHESKNPIARVEKSKSFEKQMDCEEELEVRSLISGSISEVLVKPGDRVKLGQLLIRLDSSELEQEMKDLEDSLKKWKKILYNREHWKVRSEAAEKQAKRKISEFQEEISPKQNRISQKQIHSLIGGIVIDIVVEDKMVKENMVVARIGNDAVLKIILSVGEELSLGEFERLQEGEKISLTFKKLNMACSGEVKKRDPYIIIRIP
ncbi:MAG: biotin/lipoyl-binding protein, partial [Candidatus Aminicenantes bacterium]|nr:biotin/lipoyl-binding protein [Candidatus Aminicenantes bacterium]